MTKKVAHPGKTPAQRRVLDAIGCGDFSPVAAKSTIAALLDQGLIEELSPKLVPVFGNVSMEVRQFQMPIWAHILWCNSFGDFDPDNFNLDEADA